MNRPLVASLLLALAACQHIEDDSTHTASRVVASSGKLALSSGADASAADAEEIPYYRQIIEWLRESDSVIPAAPPAHPLRVTYNREAIVPPMCYTRTEGKYNPCYVCHQDHIKGRENTMNDADLQEAYSFSDLGMSNHWTNLFESIGTGGQN